MNLKVMNNLWDASSHYFQISFVLENTISYSVFSKYETIKY